MPPRAQTGILRGRGRPKRSTASAFAPTPALEKKRGRVAKVDVDVVEAQAGTPKKRGRPAKPQNSVPVVVTEASRRGQRMLDASQIPTEEALAPKKRIGRPAKKQVAEAPAPAQKKRPGRPGKADVVSEDPPAAPKPRGRPARTNTAAVDLRRVAGSPRVTKSRSKPIPRATKTAAAPRMGSRIRPNLRARLLPAPKVKEDIDPQPTKRRGRPPKAAAAIQAPSLQKAAGRKAIKAAIAKPKAPRKKRGYTLLEVPDRFAARVQQYLQELQDAKSLPTPIEEHAEAEIEAEAAGADADVEAEYEEQEGDIVVEEEVLVARATGDANLDDALISETNMDRDFDADNVEDSLQDEVIEDVVIHDFVENGPAGSATEVGFEMSVQGEVQTRQDVDDMEAAPQELDADMENQDDNPTSFLDNASTEAYIHEVDSRPSASVVFARG